MATDEQILAAVDAMAEARRAMIDYRARKDAAEAEVERISAEFIDLHNAQQRAERQFLAVIDGRDQALP